MKIKTKLAVLFLLLSLVPFFIGGIISFHTIKKGLIKGIGIKLSDLAKNTVNKIDETIEEQFHDLEIWAQSSIMNEMLSGDRDGKLSAFLSLINDIQPIYLYLDCLNNQGEVIASSRPELIKQKVNIDIWIKKALNGNAGISDLHKDDLTGEYIFSSFYPILSGKNKENIIGVMRSQVKLTGIHQIVNKIKIGEQTGNVDEHIMIIDNKGLVVYAPPFEKENILHLNLLDKKMKSAETAVKGEDGYLMETSEHDRNSLIGYAHSKGFLAFMGTGWSVLVIQGPKLAFNPIMILRNQIVFLGLIISLIIIILSLFISNSISASIKYLISSSIMIADGDFSQRIKIPSDDEIGELANSFNKMAQSLEYRESMLVAARNELDDKNKKLEEANIQLSDNNRYQEYIIKGIQNLLENAVGEKSFKVRFKNPDLAKCWEIKKCNFPECPSYKNEDQRCWHIAGTLCGGEVQGKFAQKLKACQECEVYQKAVSTKLYTIGEVFNNMMELLDESYKKVEDYAKNLEIKVKERTAEQEQTLIQLKDTQSQLIQSAKLAAIGQLAAGVSHELNNPLGGIMGYSQFILEKVKNKKGFENLSKKEMESIFVYVGYIEKESKRCKDIVANLLKFSRQSKDAEFTSLNVNKVLEETLIFTRHQMEMNNVEINPKLDKGIPEILGSARQLQQVFTNLIINAQQAMKHGGKLTISTGSPDGFVEICFSDTGEGISRGNIDKLFTPFFTTKEVGEGTGLGLSISYGIIKGHGGKIEVKSEINKGSVFCVILPIKSIIE